MKIIIILIVLLSALPSYGQTADASQINREILLTETSEKIKDNYLSADVAAEIESSISAAVKSGKFNNLSDEEFAVALTDYLRSISKDKHFYVEYLKDYRPETNRTNDKKQQELDNISNSLENFGFEDVKRLAGNVGYINFKGFAEPKSSETALAAAMNFVANTNSLIIDLRENRGGDNGMLLEFCSYFFNAKTNVYQTYFRNTGKNVENWTQAKVKGQKYLSKDVYFLTSGKTFSAAEGLAFILQNYKLAKVIGEQTGGAANPVEPFIVGNKYLLLIPVGKVTTALTKTNWEQIGVTPDEKIEAKKTLTKAHILALKEVLKNKTRTELAEAEITETIKKLEGEL